MKSLSIVIPAYNEENYIEDCLKSVMLHKTPNVKEIIVIDNASTDRTAEIASSFEGVRVIYEAKKGLTSARQCGLDAATGDLLAFIDADTRISAHWFKHINHAFQMDDDLMCLSGPYNYFDLPTWQRTCVKMYWTCLAMPAYSITRFMAVGGNFVAKREALLAIGGFDTNIAFYGEDTDIARRLHTHGKVRFDLRFRVDTSGRRLAAEGLMKTAAVYAANYISQSALHRPVTHDYRDIR